MNAPEIILPTLSGQSFGGGRYAGRFVVGEQVYGLVAAPVETGEHAPTKWGSLKKVADASSYVDGLANTQAMAKAGSALAQWALALNIDGHADWYLPSRVEALIVFSTLQTAGDFVRDWYWTSTQYATDAEYAWFQYFYRGSQYYDLKGAQLRARAVRRFPIR